MTTHELAKKLLEQPDKLCLAYRNDWLERKLEGLYEVETWQIYWETYTEVKL